MKRAFDECRDIVHGAIAAGMAMARTICYEHPYTEICEPEICEQIISVEDKWQCAWKTRRRAWIMYAETAQNRRLMIFEERHNIPRKYRASRSSRNNLIYFRVLVNYHALALAQSVRGWNCASASIKASELDDSDKASDPWSRGNVSHWGHDQRQGH